MSINNSYFNKNNTIVSNSYVNTGRNPVTELFFGQLISTQYPNGYSRFIFDIDLSLLMDKISDGTISVDCGQMNHTLRMTNTSTFNIDDLNTKTSQSRMRATSFDLILFRIPNNQQWDEGVGYDFADLIYEITNDKNFSNRPSNWIQTTTTDNWLEPGIYDNKIGRAHV